MDIHEVEIEEPALVSVDLEKLGGRMEQVVVRPAMANRRVVATDASWDSSGYGAFVDLEPLTESKIRRNPAVSVDPSRSESGLLENFGRQHGFFRECVLVARDPRPGWIEGSPHRGHRALRPGRLRKVARETRTAAGQRVDGGAGVPLVAVGAETMRAERVDENEQDVQVVALCQGLDVGGRADGPRIVADELDIDEQEQECRKNREHDQQRAFQGSG